MVVTAEARRKPPTFDICESSEGTAIRRSNRCTYRTRIAHTSTEATTPGRTLFNAQNIASSQLPSDTETLHHTQNDEENRSSAAPHLVGWQQSHQNRRNCDEQNRENQSVLPPDDTISHFTKQNRTRGTHEKGCEVDTERVDQLELARRAREERGTNLWGQQTVDSKVIPGKE